MLRSKIAAVLVLTLASATLLMATDIIPDRGAFVGQAAACGAPRVDTVRAGAAVMARPSVQPPTSGNIFVSHGRSGLVSVLTLETGAVATFQSGVNGPHEVAVSPDGRWGVAADFGNHQGEHNFDGRRLAVIDLARKRVARVIDLGEHRGPHDIVFIPGSSNRAVVTTQTTRNVVEVDVETGQVVASTSTGAPGSHNVAVAADGRTAFTANQPEGTVSRLDLSTRMLVRKYHVGTDPTEGIAVTPDGREVWVASRGEGLVRAIDGATGSVLAALPGLTSTERIAMTPNGRRVLMADLRCRDVKVADVATHRVLGSIGELRDAAQPKILPDSRLAIVPLLQEGTVAVVDIEERRVLARHRFGRSIDAAGWGPAPPAAR